MVRPVNESKLMEVYALQQGDVIKLTTGETVEFIRLKAKNFVGIMGGKSYNIPVNMFDSIIEKNTKTIADTQQETMKTAQELKQGDWFYINKNGTALAFIFDSMSNSKIIGINPITKAQTRIDSSFEITKIEM